MVYVIKNAETVSKKEIDEVLSDLGFPKNASREDLANFSADSLSTPPDVTRGRITSRFSIKGVRKLFSKPKLAKQPDDKIKYMLSTFKDDQDKEVYRVKAATSKEPTFEELRSSLGEELYESAIEEKPVLLAEMASADSFGVVKDFERDIEEIVKEKWRYLVMQFGGVFLTEIRPNKIFIGNKTLADELITYHKKGKKYGLDLQKLENYLKENNKGNMQLIQIHFSDIMFNPRIKDYDIFSITSGDANKANIFLDLAKFLSGYNKGKETVIPVHLPYYEKWKTVEKVVEFGKLDENGKRDAIMKAEKVLRYLAEKWNNNVKLALETGNGASERNGQINYALIYEPHHLKFLTSGRENFVSVCEDVGHLNLVDAAKVDWREYLPEEISEFHVSGNNGREDQHVIATPETLKDYDEIMSFLKFYSGNICAEIRRGKLSADEFLNAVKKLAYTLFSEPDKRDFENLRKIENYVVRITEGKGKLCEKNLNQERYEKYRRHVGKKES